MRAIVPILLVLSFAGSAAAITRDEVMVRAHTYATHPWTCASKNLTASCSGAYQSIYVPGDYVGLPYDWGGYMSLETFDTGIQDGQGAGSQASDGILGCTVGLDCSGFVSKCWKAGHTTTSGMSGISSNIQAGQLEPGDALNVAGYHVMLFGGELAGGWPFFYEAAGYNVFMNTFGGWAATDGFQPIRYDEINNSAQSDLGTAGNPVKVSSFPFVHNGNTQTAASDMFDACGAAIAKKEKGPEMIYEVKLDEPGVLSAFVQDDAGVDIDVHIYSALETWHCEARHDSTLEMPVSCGTWYVVADTWSDGGGEYPGPYTLTIDFTPSGAGCGQWNEPFDFEGQPGDACGFPGNPNLPFCNPNLGSWVCLYTGSTPSSLSFCTYNCSGNSDCQDDFSGGCCMDIQGAGNPQDMFCVPSSLCEPVQPPVDQGPGVDTIIQPMDTPDPCDMSLPEIVPGQDTLPGQDTPQAGEDALPGQDGAVDPEDTTLIPGEDTDAPGADVDGEDDSGGGGGCRTGSEAASWPLLFLLAALAVGLRRLRFQ